MLILLNPTMSIIALNLNGLSLHLKVSYYKTGYKSKAQLYINYKISLKDADRLQAEGQKKIHHAE